ncbi:hypothetical protein FALBO_4010 [Fusarium albosuccineum]|uniref:Uncharacterized protein n=1 Tax=Fusarium albosuccineum TaxID=1237068 RepID=A0A8H4PFH1_9HYPO|nr:hypothetical protein FALBO_4010 [Fusarium albosuccineum]
MPESISVEFSNSTKAAKTDSSSASSTSTDSSSASNTSTDSSSASSTSTDSDSDSKSDDSDSGSSNSSGGGSSNSSNNHKTSNDGLKTGLGAGLGAGLPAFAGIIGAILFLMRRKKNQPAAPTAQVHQPPVGPNPPTFQAQPQYGQPGANYAYAPHQQAYPPNHAELGAVKPIEENEAVEAGSTPVAPPVYELPPGHYQPHPELMGSTPPPVHELPPNHQQYPPPQAQHPQ